VLAVHEERGVVLIAECKVLARPMNVDRLRNMISKLGEQDSEKFWSKLSKKREWVLKLGSHLTSQWSTALAFIVTNRKVPGMGDKDERMLISIEMLKDILGAIEKEYSHS
jgi:hypothetical protein